MLPSSLAKRFEIYPDAPACSKAADDVRQLRLAGLTLFSERTSMTLTPSVCIDGHWHSADIDSAELALGRVTYRVGELGTLALVLEGGLFALELTPRAACVVQGFRLDGSVALEGASGWLSNGFQSWSQSGVIALAAEPTTAALEAAHRMRGDREMLRSGAELSWWYSYVGGGEQAFFAGALSALTFRSWLSIFQCEGSIHVRLVSGASGEDVQATKATPIWSECWYAELGSDLHISLERYGKSLPSRRRLVPRPAQLGWMSWYELWDDGLNEQAVLENARSARPLLDRLAPARRLRPHVIVDDGWQKDWGDWEPNEKFPRGLVGLNDVLASEGFACGVWLAPLLVREGSQTAREHPEWLVKGAVYKHSKRGRMHILDVTHPEAADHLTSVIRRIVSWGYKYLKLDFLFAGSFEGQRREDVTGMQAYRRALELLRAAAGEDTFVLAVGAPVLGTFPYVDAYRVGFDIAIEAVDDRPMGPAWPFVVHQARNLAARWALGHATLLDAEPPLLRELPQEEVRAGAWVVALGGGALFISDDLRSLPPERTAWGPDVELASLSLGGVCSRPEELFLTNPPASLANPVVDQLSLSNQQRAPMIWRTAAGDRLVLNLSDRPLDVEGHVVPARAARRLARTRAATSVLHKTGEK